MKPRCKHAGTVEADGKRPCALGLFGGRVSKLDECQRCAKHEALVAGPEPPPAADGVRSLPVLCAHEGPVLVPCHSCRGEARHVRDCAIHGRVTRTDAGKEVDMVCETCRREGLGYAPAAP